METLALVLSLAIMALVLLTPASSEEVTIKPNYDFPPDPYKFFDIRGELVLNCNTSSAVDLEWLKDDKPVKEDKSLQGRFEEKESENTFIIDRTLELDAGNYTCRAGSAKAVFVVVAKPTVRLPTHTTVVEGEKLQLHCLAVGSPTPVVEWTIGNETYNQSRGRVKLTNDSGIENAKLEMSDITLDDRGDYYCRAINIASKYMNSTHDSTFVRVKDNLAALWPFLGICAEVFVLCAIILIYEKRRNKPEMDESDTDQSPDQKHTFDHGKERDVRHRK